MTKLMHIDMTDPPPELDGDPLDATLITPKQEVAMLALLSGDTQRIAAMRAGVREEQISRWLHSDTAFLRLYAERRADVWRCYQAKIAQLLHTAFVNLADMMADQDTDPRARLGAIQTALQLGGLYQSAPRVTSFGGQVNVAQQQVNMQRGDDVHEP